MRVLNLSNNYIGLSTPGQGFDSTLHEFDWSLFTNLERLRLDYNELTNISFVKHLPESLAHLELHGNAISDISDFGDAVLPQLKLLNLYNNQITNLEGLDLLPVLAFLYIGRNAILNWSASEMPSSIERINIAHNDPLIDDGNADVTMLRSNDVSVLTRYFRPVQTTKSAELALDVSGAVPKVRSISYFNTYSGPLADVGETIGQLDVYTTQEGVSVPVIVPAPEPNCTADHSEEEDGESAMEPFYQPETRVVVPLTSEIVNIDFDYGSGTKMAMDTQVGITTKPGHPIPISIRLMHGGDKPDEPEKQFVLYWVADGFTAGNLGDFDHPVERKGGDLNWSETVGDSVDFVLGQEPFRSYRNHMSIYRIDIISEEAGTIDYTPGDDYNYPDLAFGLTRGGSSVWDGWKSRQLIRPMLNDLGLAFNAAVVLGQGSPKGSADGNVFSSRMDMNGRRFTTIHELGHATSRLGDERADSFQCGCLRSQRRPNTIRYASKRVPPIDQVAWRHWIEHPAELCAGAPFDACTTGTGLDCSLGNAMRQTALTHCSAPVGDFQASPIDITETPLPTCEFDITQGKLSDYLGDNRWPVVGLYAKGQHRVWGFRPQLRCYMTASLGGNNGDGEENAAFCFPCREEITQQILRHTGLVRDVSPTPDEVLASTPGTPMAFEVTPRLSDDPRVEVQWTLAGETGVIDSQLDIVDENWPVAEPSTFAFTPTANETYFVTASISDATPLIIDDADPLSPRYALPLVHSDFPDFSVSNEQHFGWFVTPNGAPQTFTTHPADLDMDNAISVSELEAFRSLYETSVYGLAAGYSRDPAGLEGFAPGPGPRVGPLHPAETTTHSSWKFSPADFVRLIELHHAGAYEAASGSSPDGFQPYPASPGDDVSLVPSISIEGNPSEYVPGTPLTIKFSVTPESAGELAAMGFRISLSGTRVPPFWTISDISSTGGPSPDIVPPDDTFRRFDFFWTNGVNFDQSLAPMELRLEVVPEGESEVITVNFRVLSRGGGNYRFKNAASVALGIDENLLCDEQ